MAASRWAHGENLHHKYKYTFPTCITITLLPPSDEIIYMILCAFNRVEIVNSMRINGAFLKVNTYLTHWGRVTHICVIKLTIIGSDNGLSPGRLQAITWTNVGILLIGPKRQWNFKLNSNIFIQENALENVVCEWLPFCLGLGVLKHIHWSIHTGDSSISSL